MLVDAHCHLHRTRGPIAPVLAELRRRHVFAISVATDVDAYRQTQRLAAGSELVLPTLGIHPVSAAAWVDRLDEVEALLDETPMLGEVGLDYHWVEDSDTYAAQRAVLDRLLAGATERDLVVNLHTKAAEEDVLAALRRHDVRRAIVHWYSGPVLTFRELLDRGCLFTVGVEVLCSDIIRDIAREIPADRLLIETDGPGAWEWLTGEQEERSLLDVQLEVARVREVPVTRLQDQVAANFEALIAGDVRLTIPYERARATLGS